MCGLTFDFLPNFGTKNDGLLNEENFSAHKTELQSHHGLQTKQIKQKWLSKFKEQNSWLMKTLSFIGVNLIFLFFPFNNSHYEIKI